MVECILCVEVQVRSYRASDRNDDIIRGVVLQPLSESDVYIELHHPTMHIIVFYMRSHILEGITIERHIWKLYEK